ncbi:submaxillary mucin-like protein isoform X2 [Rhinolophus ferrumequinum]|uniref:submaxillary mucin-like protein isoform X2 n=1 Tax=Rhinolophus ferrumequinum TaxID=59479 RepID=UPI00140FA8BC|nr:submaxillary mucin-like protein isoform X2 [Rhinolophus ferrumequinum]
MSSRTTILSGSSRTEATTSTEGGGTPGTGPRPGTTGPQGGISAGSGTGTTGVAPGTTVAPGSSNTGATSFPGESETTGFGIGAGTTTTGPGEALEPGSHNTGTSVSPGNPLRGSGTGGPYISFSTTILSGSSPTEATTSTEGGGTPGTGPRPGATTLMEEHGSPGIITGTNEDVSGKTLEPGSTNTEATTSAGGSGTTQEELPQGTSITPGGSVPGTEAGVTNIIPGSQYTGSKTVSGTTSLPEGFKTGITGIASGTTVIPASANTGATTGVGMETSASVISSGITGFPESSSPGTFKEASETTTAPGISTMETTVVTTGDQEIENKSGCPASLPPPPVCHGPLGEEKSPGDIWTANCHRCTCTDANAVDCKLKECPSLPKCKAGEKLIKFKANDTCCEIGYCEPRTCLFNNTNYEIGASFGDSNNPCISYSCQNTGLVAVVQDCPKQTWCSEKDRVYDSNKCCYTCNTNCRSSLVNVTVKYNGCKKKVEMARCTGECKKTIKYNYDIFQLENSCLCCQDEKYEFREIVLDCPDGNTIPYRYRHITVCSCLDKCQHSMNSMAT